MVSNQRSHSIPTKLPVLLPARKVLLQLVTQAPDVVAMDGARLETSDEFEKQARRTIFDRGLVGIGYRYSNMQPTSAPAIDKGLIGKWLDVCLKYFLIGGGTKLR